MEVASDMSSGVSIGLFIKNFEQLGYLLSLYTDGILAEEEYMEQKKEASWELMD